MTISTQWEGRIAVLERELREARKLVANLKTRLSVAEAAACALPEETPAKAGATKKPEPVRGKK
jgi:hypothetical protein